MARHEHAMPRSPLPHPSETVISIRGEEIATVCWNTIPPRLALTAQRTLKPAEMMHAAEVLRTQFVLYGGEQRPTHEECRGMLEMIGA